MMNLEFPVATVAYLFSPTLAFPRSAVQGWPHACPHGFVYTGYPTRPQNFVIVAGKVRLTQVATRGEGQPARGREWARVALKDKELHKPQFLLVLHISLSSIYITLHIFQVHTKCILYGIINYLIWFEDGYSILQLLMRLTSPMSLIEQKINVCHVSAILKHVTVSFRSMKASRPYLQWMQFPQTFYAWIFNVNLLGFFSPEIFVRQKCFVFFLCVHMY